VSDSIDKLASIVQNSYVARRRADYRIRYDDGTMLTFPFSRRLVVGDMWKDSLALWRVVRVDSARPGDPIDVWVKPILNR
jgi:hypothetical protein